MLTNATPRRPALTSRPQGMYTHGPSALPYNVDKSPSIRNRTQRPGLLHKQSHPPLKTPPTFLNLADATATAPARVPVPKRMRDLDELEVEEPRVVKRARSASLKQSPEKYPITTKKSRTEERDERIRQEERFRDKYARAFPGWKFYFDSIDVASKASLSARIQHLGGRIEDFFSSSVTHFITNKPVPTADEVMSLENKENAPIPMSSSRSLLPSTSRGPTALRSPIQLKATVLRYDPLVSKAVHFQMKIWDEKKLDSILGRIQAPSGSVTRTARAAAAAGPSPSLSYLLETERKAGVTYERDPTVIRPDHNYFGRSSYFVLVEDIDGTHAPIAVKEYGRWKEKLDKDGIPNSPPWPGLRDQPGKAKPGWADGKLEDEDADSEEEVGEEDDDDEIVLIERPEPEPEGHRLRRTVSMHSLGHARQLQLQQRQQEEALAFRSTHLAKGKGKAAAPHTSRRDDYVAASGNSVIITSNINSTTSFGQSQLLNPLENPSSKLLSKRLHQQVLTNRTFSKPDVPTGAASGTPTADGPPRPYMLRKSKSTNTMKVKLPAREEVKKPGYCENCRLRFDDFSKHIIGKRHSKFADDDSNFWSLDEVLARLERRELTTIAKEERDWLAEARVALDQAEAEQHQEELARASQFQPVDEDVDMHVAEYR